MIGSMLGLSPTAFASVVLSEYLVDFRYLPLQRLTRFRNHLMHSMSREKTYFLTNVFLKFSSLGQNEFFSDNIGATLETVLLEFLTPEEIATRPLEESNSILLT
jgi:hypothetical protein